MLKRFGAALGGLLVIGFVRVRLRLPDGAARMLAGWTGALAGRLAGPRRRVVLRNLRRAFPDATDADRARLAAAFFRGTAGWFTDLLLLFREGRDRSRARYTVDGAEHLRAALAGGRGAIGVSAHLGPFPGLAVAIPSL